MTWPEYVQFFVALVAIVDPLFTVPIFLSYTAAQSTTQRRRTARLIAITVAVVLLIAAASGEWILSILGTSLASFQVGGGLVLLVMALGMLTSRPGELSGEKSVTDHYYGEEGGVVPLGIPLLAGPGAISSVVITAHRSEDWPHFLIITGVILIVSLIIWAAFRLAEPLAQWMDRITLGIANRLLGLILAAIAVEYMARGFRSLFPILKGS